jgi:adenosylcobyric acid synthase
MNARAVMVLGTTSGAGKSWLCTALCRWYARRGFKVAPFKAQNMSNNARVVAGTGDVMGEMGSAQYFQALAARALPDVRMNPVLLKPEHDTATQVVVLGQVRADFAQVPWCERSELLWPFAREALRSLLHENEVVVIEGAGSPAEINLHASDYVNMRTAREAHAACLLVTDIDRGGAFAHLFGTHQLLPLHERALIRGFVLNKFRGDAALLTSGLEELEGMTGVPTLAVLPMWRGHGLPEEDGLFDESVSGTAGTRIAIVAYPRMSNLDEFQSLRQCRGIDVRWARTPAALAGAEWIVLPGSKHTSGDLAWLREQGLDAPLIRHAAAGGRVLGLCGGLQMLGGDMVDPDGVDGSARGLGLLALHTRFEPTKMVRRTEARFSHLTHEWKALSGVSFDGYEIRHGRTTVGPDVVETSVALRNEHGEAIGWQRGNVLALYCHGLFESSDVMRALFGVAPRTLDASFEGMADFIDVHFESGALSRLIRRSC